MERIRTSTCQHWVSQAECSQEKWHLPVFLILDKVSTDFCPFGTCYKISQQIPFTYSSSTFQTAVFILSLKASEFVHGPCKSGVSVFFSPVALPELSLTDFQSQTFWGAGLLSEGPQGLKHPTCGLSCWGCGSQPNPVSALPTCLNVSFSLYL